MASKNSTEDLSCLVVEKGGKGTPTKNSKTEGAQYVGKVNMPDIVKYIGRVVLVGKRLREDSLKYNNKNHKEGRKESVIFGRGPSHNRRETKEPSLLTLKGIARRVGQLTCKGVGTQNCVKAPSRPAKEGGCRRVGDVIQRRVGKTLDAKGTRRKVFIWNG